MLYLVDDFANVNPGEPIRLFPFGRIVKNGKAIDITPELAREFKLPQFRPPIKLGSHAEETPAGGYIKRLFVGDDGLYADVEYTEKGLRALEEGDYRYHSPEVVWEDGAVEMPDGKLVEGPMIVGDALTHTPHLGSATALFTVEPEDKGESDMADTVPVPVDMWERVMGLFDRPEPEVLETEPDVDPDEFSALQAERDDLQARLSEIEENEARATRVEHFESELAEAEAVAEDEELPEVLADLPEESATAVLQKILALAERVDMSALTEERGSGGAGAEAKGPIERLHARIDALMAEEDLSYTEAANQLRQAEPELFEAAYGRKETS